MEGFQGFISQMSSLIGDKNQGLFFIKRIFQDLFEIDLENEKRLQRILSSFRVMEDPVGSFLRSENELLKDLLFQIK